LFCSLRVVAVLESFKRKRLDQFFSPLRNEPDHPFSPLIARSIIECAKQKPPSFVIDVFIKKVEN